MKRYITDKTVLVGLLLVVFTLPYVVKSAHLYHYGYRVSKCLHTDHCSHTEHPEHSEHDCTNCPVCQFAISFFTETELVHTPAIIQVIDSVILSEYKEEIHISCFTANHLRAPPIC